MGRKMYVDFNQSEEKTRFAMNGLFALIIANVLCFLMIPTTSELFRALLLDPFDVKHFEIWRVFSYMFLHGGWMHLLVNMWGLYLFGSIIAPELGATKFTNLYLISGVSGALFWLLFNWNTASLVVGASGALFGIMLATAMLYPDKEFILLLFPFPIKTKTMVVVYAVIEILSLPSLDNIAHLAHLGGFVGAYIYIKFLYGKNVPWDIIDLFKGNKKSTRGWTIDNYKPDDNAERPVNKDELDRILDKISQYGVNSLSESENLVLRKAREQMKNNKD